MSLAPAARRKFFTFMFSTTDNINVKINVGAYSVRQAWWLFHQSKKCLGFTTILYRVEWWKTKCPKGAPKGPFVMYNEMVLIMNEGGRKDE